MSGLAHSDRWFELSLDMLCIAGFDGYFKRLNPAWTRVLGWPLPELLARPYLDFVHADDHSRTIEEADKLAQGGCTIVFENRYRCKDGTYKWVEWNAFPFPDEQLIYAVARDITDRKQVEGVLRESHERLERRFEQAHADLQQEIGERKWLEEQLLHSQKMDAIGRLAGGVAHDFNNMLTVINGYSDLLIEAGELRIEQRRILDQIRQAGSRAAELTRQLLAFSRKQVLQPVVLDVNEVVRGMEPMLARIVGEHIKLLTTLSPHIGLTKADPGQLEQVVMNLVINARDAMPQGGTLTIETGNVVLDKSYTAQHPDAQPGPHVVLALSDTGMGMDAETRARIFEPFFTTKEKGKGTGLGLSTVYGVVRQSGGSIYVYSEPGRGTTFKVYFPRVEDVKPAVFAQLATSGPEAAVRGTETVLLVEDDPAVRMFVRLVLEQHGYSVLEVTNGSEAVLFSERYGGMIHLLLTDVVLPGESGKQIADRLLAARPAMQVLYMSGYTDDAVVHHGVLDPGTILLQKPFGSTALLTKIREALAAPKTA